jgi:hypothetical protein
VQRLNGEFLDAFDSIARTVSSLTSIKPLPCSLSTCTFAGRLGFGDDAPEAEQEARFGRIVAGLYDTMDLMESIDDGGCEFTLVRDGPAGDDDQLDAQHGQHGQHGSRKRAAPPKKKFHNQVSLRCDSKSIKLFKNGSVHGTGCPSPILFFDIVDKFCDFLATIEDLPAAIHLKSFHIGMINAMFVINDRAGRLLKIRLEALTALAAEESEGDRGVGRAEQELELHPGVKIPLFPDPADRSKKITIRFFQTGSVSITGARKPEHVAMAHAHACRVLDAHAAAVCYPDAKTALRSTTAKQRFDLVGGYVHNQFDACFTAEAHDRAAVRFSRPN